MTSAAYEASDRAGETAAAGEGKSGARKPAGRGRLWVLAAAAMGAGLFALAILQLAALFRESALDQERISARTKLELIAVGLAGELAKFEAVAEILAGDSRYRGFLRGDDAVTVEEINARLAQVRDESDALDVYLLDRAGTTLAASNWNQEISFVGRNFRYRPYFQDAISRGFGKFFAVGTTSGVRGYYFAYPIVHGSRAIGVMAVKMQIDHLEPIWDRNGSDVLVADDNGIVFMATDARWRLHSLWPISAEAREQIRQTRQYPEDAYEVVPIETLETLAPDERIVRLADANDPAGEPWLMQELNMPQAGWTLILLSDLSRVDRTVLRNSVLVAACAAALFGMLWVAFERQRRTRDRLESERRHRAELEKLVEARTRGLTTAYEELRGVQEQLVLNSRFAVMGRLSAGLSHEISQPLTAIGAHLDNARELIARDRIEEARERLADIHRLSARITKIVRQLKILAHGSRIELSPVSVRRAAETAMGLLREKLAGAGVDFDIEEDGLIHVMAEPVLFEQVFVNLFSNSVQALAETPGPGITVSVSRSPGWVEIAVSDNGPGLEPARLEEIFEPFVTTRSGQGGLGLGLTIVQDTIVRFGGRIRAENKLRGGGLVITLSLRAPPGRAST